MDKERRQLFGLAENGHLYRYYIDENYTEDLGRVAGAKGIYEARLEEGVVRYQARQRPDARQDLRRHRGALF